MEAVAHLIEERKSDEKLLSAGVAPTRTALFCGEPGVGKTLTARWIAKELQIPLLTLDLSAVMSSFLGRTGSNLRSVLDYAKDHRSLLLLDEFDAIAKRRDDSVEVGELKRLVTVLLQEIDDWPPTNLLIAATNHSSLLDPAAWRRFDLVLDFPRPTEQELRAKALQVCSGFAPPDAFVDTLSQLYKGSTLADLEKDLRRSLRHCIIADTALSDELGTLVAQKFGSLNGRERGNLAVSLVRSGMSQREASSLTGVSRDTIRRRIESKQRR